MTIINHMMDGFVVQQRTKDGYLNATALAKAYEAATGTRKDVRDWLLTSRAKLYIERLSAKTGKPVLELVQVKKGGNTPGTWLHPKLCIPFATWLSVEFEFQVSEWVEQWMTTGKNPTGAKSKKKKLPQGDRYKLRVVCKNEARTAMTDEIRDYLIKIGEYCNKKKNAQCFARIHDQINVAITTETSRKMRKRIEEFLGEPISEDELIRDYFPANDLQKYIAMCNAIANLMIRQGAIPDNVVALAAQIALPPRYVAKPIDFEKHYMSEMVYDKD